MLVHSDIQAKKTVADLQAWFQTHQRDLPWRKNYDPYEIWISEIMLQQTQVETVIPYFLRWKENLRGIKEVASASQRELLKLWEGLGYYRRVKNIKATAEILVERYQSRLPENHGELLKLPGIGEYTAGAILSIAYEAPFSVLDGNVARVFSRYFGWSLEIRTKESRDFFNRMSMKMLKYARPRDFNQGLMELGALVCLPANPKCVVCPLVSRCHSHNKDLTRCLPVINKKKTIKLEQLFIILKCAGSYFIKKQGEKELWPGLFSFPIIKMEGLGDQNQEIIRATKNRFSGNLIRLDALKKFKYSVTKYTVLVTPLLAELSYKTPQLDSLFLDGIWFEEKELFQLPVSKPTKSILTMIGKGKRTKSKAAAE